MAGLVTVVTCPLCCFQMTINSQKLKESQEKIEKLLTDKQAFNSKVVTETYTQFKAAAIKIRNGQAADIRSSTRKLEICLKDEGSYKNVKSEFEKIKRDIDEVTDLAEHMTEERKRNSKLTQGRGGLDSKPRATTVTLSQAHTRQNAKVKDVHVPINRPVIGKNEQVPTTKKEGVASKAKNDKSPPGHTKDEVLSIKARKEEASPRDKKDVTPSKVKKEPILEIKGENISTEDIATLNKMISRLFSQLEIDTGSPVSKSPRASVTKQSPQKQQAQAALTSSLQVKKLKPDDTNLKTVIDRLKQLEDELTKRKTQKSNEASKVTSLENEVQKLEKQIAEQSKQLDRFRGLQSITNKAKGKHVELIEERHQTEKKDMEIKIQALEKDLKKNVQGTMREKEDLENKVSQDLSKLRQEIFRLHSVLESEQTSESSRSVKTKPAAKENVSNFEMDEMLEKIRNIGNEIQALRESKTQLKRTADEKSDWELSFKDLEKEVEIFCIDISEGSMIFPLSEFDSTEALKSLRTSKTHAGPSKWKLNKAKTLLLNFVRKSEETERVMWAKTNEVDDAQMRLKELTAKVANVYEHIKIHEASVLDDSLSLQYKGSLAGGLKDIRSESRRDLSEESSEDMTLKQKMEYVEKTIHSYESLLKVQNKALKQNEIDYELMHSKLSHVIRSSDKSYKRQKSTASKQVVFEEDAHIDAVTILKQIDEVNYELLQLREQNKEIKSGLNAITKAKDYLEETSKELTELCVQHGVSDELISGSGDEDTVHKIKRKINLCRTEFSKLFEELQVKESKYKKCQIDVENIAKEVHTIFLNTLEETADKKEDKEKKEAQPKLIIVELKTINEHYVKLQENVKKMSSTIQAKNREITEIERSFKHNESDLNDQITKLQMQVAVREEELQERHKETKILRDEANQKNTENTRLQLELQSRYTSNLGKSDDEKIYLRNKIDDLQRKLEAAEHNLSDALTEKFNLLTRISVSAGTKLTDDNPMIANLSDPNRPTRLAEKYSELYDKEWTNAFETLRNQFYMEEKDAISSLLSVITKGYTFCQSLANKQSDEIYKVLLLLHVDGIVEPGFKEGMQKISKETKKQVKDIRKVVAPETIATVLGLYLSSDTDKTLTDEQMQACDAYISHCIELCWLMCVQDPPVNISWNLQSGAKFNSDLYRHYTKSGDSVDFLVWPTLRLHQEGPLLFKGVAQGK